MGLFFLSLLILLCSTSALGAIYETFEELPTLDFDFIIVGGSCYSSQNALLLTPSIRRNGGKCRRESFDRGLRYLCARPRSGWIVGAASLKLFNVNFVYRTKDVLLAQVPFFCPEASPATPLDWNFTTTEQPGFNGRSITYPRGYGLGGSSAISTSLYLCAKCPVTDTQPDYLLYTRGSSQDYDRYAQISGDPGWGWEALQPYFLKVSDVSCFS